MVFLQVIENLDSRVSVGVAVADGDDRVLGMDSGQERRNRRGLAAMVADFEQIRMKILSQHVLLAAFLGIAFEQTAVWR